MHFSYLVTVDVPEIKPDPINDALVDTQIRKLELEKEADNSKKFMLDIYLKELYGLRNPFARKVYEQLYNVMEPYSENTENPDYLYFEDRTEELREEYENGTVDCIKLPEGRKVSVDNRAVFDKFIIGEDGKVYQKYYGQLKHPKRSKRAKIWLLIRIIHTKSSIKPLTNLPQKKGISTTMRNIRGMDTHIILMLFGTGIRLAADGLRCFLLKTPARNILSVNAVGAMKAKNTKLLKAICGLLQLVRKTLSGRLITTGI